MAKSSGVKVQAARIVIGDLNALLDEPKTPSKPALRTAAIVEGLIARLIEKRREGRFTCATPAC